jgi:hypothetical protein
MPSEVGAELVQLVTITCISRSTWPISTPFLYSFTPIFMTAVWVRLGVNDSCPVAELILVPELVPSGFVALEGEI